MKTFEEVKAIVELAIKADESNDYESAAILYYEALRKLKASFTECSINHKLQLITYISIYIERYVKLRTLIAEEIKNRTIFPAGFDVTFNPNRIVDKDTISVDCEKSVHVNSKKLCENVSNSLFEPTFLTPNIYLMPEMWYNTTLNINHLYLKTNYFEKIIEETGNLISEFLFFLKTKNWKFQTVHKLLTEFLITISEAHQDILDIEGIPPMHEKEITKKKTFFSNVLQSSKNTLNSITKHKTSIDYLICIAKIPYFLNSFKNLLHYLPNDISSEVIILLHDISTILTANLTKMFIFDVKHIINHYLDNSKQCIINLTPLGFPQDS
eukprot:TRINITY_DN1040_c0_g1_i1.p1 TRINITY_DN1040_c0_g1~~TRINITY_DN1040_c0_g1_i1.p1  ORF type:complete len:326 (+),score=75.25 TRINITY_DN1040_c0_g1_i1:55-1032(+)